MSKLNIMTINTQHKLCKYAHLYIQLINIYNIDILLCQDTGPISSSKDFTCNGFSIKYSKFDPDDTYGQVATIYSNLLCKNISFETNTNRFQVIKLTTNTTSLNIINIYIRPKDKIPQDKLSIIDVNNTIIAGDLNSTANPKRDRSPPSNKTKEPPVSDLLEKGFLDVFRFFHSGEDKFSRIGYFKYTDQIPPKSRIDYFLIDPNLTTICLDCDILQDLNLVSDHCPVILKLNLKIEKTNKQIRKKY